ncbi:nucleoporin-like protein 2 [Anoplophora glabripennis]|nr:nucleoporin-like protein 2 [Anoplophora glabripennis]
MVVCKFFLQGTCKFGDFCKFEHQLNDNYTNFQNSTPILRQSHFGNTQQQAKPTTNPSNVDTSTLVKSVVNDMTVAEKGGQWLLSCYAPFKEKPAFPSFEDHSFEEIRLGYYEAVKNGTLEQFKQQVQMMLQQAVMRMKSLQSPSPDIVNILKCIYNTPPSSYCGVYGSNPATTTTAFNNTANTSGAFNQQQTSFGQQPTSSVFPQSNQNIFAKPTQPQNQFGGASSIFGGGASQNQAFKGQSNSIFPNTQTQIATDNIFRHASGNFATQGSNSLFGGQPTTTQAGTSPAFAGLQSTNGPMFSGGQSAGGSIFGGQVNNSIFGGQQNVSPTYGSQTQPNSGNVFNNSFPNQNANNAFGQSIFGVSNAQATVQNMPQQGSANIFGIGANQPQNAQKSMFAQQQPIFAQQNAGTVFNQQATSPPFRQTSSSVTDAKSHSNSIFGSGQNTVISNPQFGQVQQVDESIYSKLEDLTEDEVKWFNSDDLDVSNIPEKPPTYQMCFKT